MYGIQFSDKKSTGSGVDNNNKTKQNIQLAEELHKRVFRNLKKNS